MSVKTKILKEIERVGGATILHLSDELKIEQLECISWLDSMKKKGDVIFNLWAMEWQLPIENSARTIQQNRDDELIKELIRQAYEVGSRDGIAGIYNENRTKQQVTRLYYETINLARNPADRDYLVIEIDKKREGDIGEHLQKSVGVWMKKGFVPSGSVFTTDNMIFQPMIKQSIFEDEPRELGISVKEAVNNLTKWNKDDG